MPINIYIEETGKNLDELCDDIWDLPNQINAFETWLDKKGRNLDPSKYVADIGFDIRKDATGGGAVLSSNSMKIMGEIGMDMYFSEYPSSEEK
jgi:Tat protein secretion system quality control protein TatD with DNase activity